MLYLHIGLHKTGTSFLQREVFPKFQGIKFVHGTNIERYLCLKEGEDYFASYEGLSGPLGSSHTERDVCIKRLSEFFPNAKILISFRRHDDFIVSHFKQHLHKGGTLLFEEFFDIESDSGRYKREDFLFHNKIESVIRHFGSMPFVFLYEEINRDLEGLLRDIGDFIGATPPKREEIRFKYYNEGVNYYQANLLRRLNMLSKSELNPEGRYRLDNPITSYLKVDPRSICQKWLWFLPNGDFLTKAHREKILRSYEEDYERIQVYAGMRMRPESGVAAGTPCGSEFEKRLLTSVP
jgi:hypothetical protein